MSSTDLNMSRGDRGNLVPSMHENPSFRDMIRKTLRLGDLNEDHIELLTDKSAMIEFTKAFTTKTYDPYYNYEMYEIMGDATTNKVVVWYYLRRFPELMQGGVKGGMMGSVGIMGRLKIEGVKKEAYADFSKTLGFWEYIRMTKNEETQTLKHLEDVFEAFCGCLEWLIETRVGEHCGYGIVYELMKKLLDDVEIDPYNYEELYDAKSKINNEIGTFGQDQSGRNRLTFKYDTFDRKNEPGFNKETDYDKKFISSLVITDTTTGKQYRGKPAYASQKKVVEKKAAQNFIDAPYFANLHKQYDKIVLDSYINKLRTHPDDKNLGKAIALAESMGISRETIEKRINNP